MPRHSKTGDYGPLSRAYRRYARKLKCMALIAAVLLLVVAVKGVPHVQTTYSYYGPKDTGWTPAHRRVSAWYISVTGRKHIRSGQYGNDGCPVILFVPLRDCLPNSF